MSCLVVEVVCMVVGYLKYEVFVGVERGFGGGIVGIFFIMV